MPEVNAKTRRSNITIAEVVVACPQPYTEGHPLTVNEAAALNQTYAENVRNNLAKRVKEKPGEAQSIVDEYCQTYEFGVRRAMAGGDPVEKEAMDMARAKVKEALKANGHVLKDIPAEKITELAQGVLDKYPQIREQAKSIVESRQSLVLEGLGNVQA